MAEVYKNSNAPASTKIFWGGAIVDADGEVLVDIYDVTQDPAILPSINPEVAIQEDIIAYKSEVDYGSYQINVPYPVTNRNKSLKLVWKYHVDSNEVHQKTFVDVVTPYAPLAEVIEDLGLGTDQSDPMYKTYHELIMAEKFARKIIENYTNQRFYIYDGVETIIGSGSDVLPMPIRIDKIHEVYANDILLIDNINNINNWMFAPIVSETGFGLRVDRANSLDNSVYTANGMVPPSVNDTYNGAFIKDIRYRVQGKFGWAEVPDNVEQATIQLIRDYFSKDRIWTNKYLKTIKTFDWQFEYGSDAYSGTGNAYADQLLDPYVINSMVVI